MPSSHSVKGSELLAGSIPDVPVRANLRPCCAFGAELRPELLGIPIPFYEIPNVLGVADLGPHLYDAGIFDQQFAGAFRFAAAGFYHGVIRIRGATELDVNLSRVLHHELVHAALDAAAPTYTLPAWLNEGLAEWFEARAQGKRHLSAREQAILSSAKSNGALFSFATLSTPSFGHLESNAAYLAYLQSYGMVEFLASQRGERSLREFCDRLMRTRNLERSLKHVFRENMDTLAAQFVAELG